MPLDDVVHFGQSWPATNIVGPNAEQMKGRFLLQLLDVLANLPDKILVNDTAFDASVDDATSKALLETRFCLPDDFKLFRQVANDVSVSVPHLGDKLVFDPVIEIINPFTHKVAWVNLRDFSSFLTIPFPPAWSSCYSFTH